MRAAAVVLGLAGGMVLAACGAAGLPELQPCTAPTPIIVPSGASDSDIAGAYRDAITEGIDSIIDESLDFSGRHPRRELSNNSTFRNDYVDSEQRNVCQAGRLIALVPPAAYLDDFHEELSKTLGEYIEAMAFGHEAVKSRNVSDFQAWDRREVALLERLTIAGNGIPTGP